MVAHAHPIPAYYSFIDPQKNEWLNWPGWLTCCGRFTHNSRPSPASGTWDGKFARQRPTFYHCATQPISSELYKLNYVSRQQQGNHRRQPLPMHFPGELLWTRTLLASPYVWPLCVNMASSTKPEVQHNISQPGQNIQWSLDHWSGLCSRTDRESGKHADPNTLYNGRRYKNICIHAYTGEVSLSLFVYG